MTREMAAGVSLGSVVAATFAGARFGPQRPRAALWYAGLDKPSYTPPGPAIGAAWTVLDGLLCLTGYRLLRQPPGFSRGVALAGWSGVLAGLAGFPLAFFGRRRLGESTAVAAAMTAMAAGTAVASARVDRVAAAATLPLVAWTVFATLLSEELWRRN